MRSAGRVISCLKRGWTAIVAVVLVAAVAFAVERLHGMFGSDDVVSRPRADMSDASSTDSKRVLFEVFGSPGSAATINFLDLQNRPRRVEDAMLPWSILMTTTDPAVLADLRAQGNGSFIGCRITVNGVITDERSTNNVDGFIACLDKSA